MPFMFAPELLTVLPPLDGQYAAIAFPALVGVILYQERKHQAALERERQTTQTLFDANAANVKASASMLEVTEKHTTTIKALTEIIEKQGALIEKLYNASDDTARFARGAIDEFRSAVGAAHNDHRAILDVLEQINRRAAG